MARPVVLAYGFRTFFLLAPAWGVLALTLWTLMLGGRMAGPALPAAQWHSHEMLFGFVMATAGGFFLTAITHWCNRPPLAGARLAGLAGLWLAGRVAIWFWGALPPVTVAVIDLAYPVAFALFASTELLRHGQKRDRILPVIFAVFIVANLMFHAEWLGWLEDGAAMGGRLFLAAVALKIGEVAGRIIPTFTETWAEKHGLNPALVRRVPWLNHATQTAVAAFVPLYTLWPEGWATAGVAMVAAVLTAWRLWGWQGWRTWRDPLLAVLHLGYWWIAIGFALVAVQAMAPSPLPSALLHGLAAGAIGTWALALMSRASLGHTGRPPKVAWWMVPAYGAVVAGSVVRLSEPWVAATAVPAVLAAAAGLWSLGYLVFLAGYGRWLISPRVDGKPG